jgi:catechol 2,3-dioxygenase-like lactoylglutathione lyase family enzyme
MKAIFQHLHLICRNLEPMINFWMEAFGAKLVVRRKMGAADGAELLLSDSLRLCVRGPRPGDGDAKDASRDTSFKYSSFDHVGYTVDSMHEALNFLEKRDDVTLTRPPFQSGQNCCAFIRGPEGIHIELVELGAFGK